MKNKKIQYDRKEILIISGVILFFIGINYWSYYTNRLYQELKYTKQEFAISTSTLESIIINLKTTLNKVKKDNENLSSVLSNEQKRSMALEQVRASNEKQIDTLTKLTTIDPELLKKYSKVYFLSENYIPSHLVDIATTSLSNKNKTVQILDKVYPFLNFMLTDAQKDNIPLQVLSGYRSFAYQKNLKSEYKIIYGAGTANQFSAEQGYSEHQLGSTLDFTTPTTKDADIEFEKSTAFTWLNANAYKYGFIISYPKANTYYQYEPWHWRFVGRKLAQDLHTNSKYYYQLDQREIDQYLINFFD